jgi:ABC-type branched-subunit amino acid transport system ATPase component
VTRSPGSPLGLQPDLVDAVFGKVTEISREQGVTVLIVEQKVRQVLAVSHRVYSLKLGTCLVALASARRRWPRGKDAAARRSFHSGAPSGARLRVFPPTSPTTPTVFGISSCDAVLRLSPPGLQPNLVDAVFEKVAQINREQAVTVLIAEQKVRQALAVSHRVYSLKLGKVSFEGVPADLADNTDRLRELFL